MLPSMPEQPDRKDGGVTPRPDSPRHSLIDEPIYPDPEFDSESDEEEGEKGDKKDKSEKKKKPKLYDTDSDEDVKGKHGVSDANEV